ncbi:MAG: cupin domain-containing protein [Opitutaceae bacterium]
MPKHTVINPGDLNWRKSNLMMVPNADFLERTGSANLGARLWKLPPRSANTLHNHITAEEFYFVLEGVGRIRIDGEVLTIEKHGGVHVMPDQLRQIFNDSDSEVLWLIIGGPEKELAKGEVFDPGKFYPTDPKALPQELDGYVWPPEEG